MAILLKGRKPDNFEQHNSIKLSFTNIRGLRFKLFDCKSFLESNSLDILTLCEANLDASIDCNFFMRGYLPLILEDSTTHMKGLAVYVREAIHLQFYLQKTLQILFYVFDWLYFTQCLTSFFSVDHLLRLYARFLILFHLTQMRFSPSTHLVTCLSLETLTSIIRTG